IPWLGDLPGVGALFRYRTQSKTKRELLVILTPHIVRNRLEAERVLNEEKCRIDWIASDIAKVQGWDPRQPAQLRGSGPDQPTPMPFLGPMFPSAPTPEITPPLEVLPTPKPAAVMPPTSSQVPGTPASYPARPGDQPINQVPPAPQEQEKWKWN